MYSNDIKDARRACHEKLVDTMMKPDQYPDDLYFVLDECCYLFEDMRQAVHNERYEGIIHEHFSAK